MHIRGFVTLTGECQSLAQLRRQKTAQFRLFLRCWQRIGSSYRTSANSRCDRHLATDLATGRAALTSIRLISNSDGREANARRATLLWIAISSVFIGLCSYLLDDQTQHVN